MQSHSNNQIQNPSQQLTKIPSPHKQHFSFTNRINIYQKITLITLKDL